MGAYVSSISGILAARFAFVGDPILKVARFPRTSTRQGIVLARPFRLNRLTLRAVVVVAVVATGLARRRGDGFCPDGAAAESDLP